MSYEKDCSCFGLLADAVGTGGRVGCEDNASVAA
jgi:hypothetical protein